MGVVLTSGKGGVGKTTSTAALGAVLAQSGETVGVSVTLCNDSSAVARAYRDAMRRLKGENLPMTIPSDPKHLLGRLFGRKAA